MRAVSVKLPQLLSLLPRDGIGASVYASRWAGKGLPVPTAASHEGDATCRWDVKKVRLVTKDGRVTGRAWGVLHWKGKRVTPEDKEYERIRGGLKYLWQSAVPPPLLVRHPRRAGAAAEPEAAPAEPAQPEV
ncbi:hypothetical protein Rhopal_002870-T1 [Rhodotorula paludigena]|uniref:Uncharacterized protein n=1 Tax=Rhodotorula paludigena TaxID=86838 RepID=A0AAV5GBB4_9BASI|nr:hypothetical protein Rhopal_002870-T1 [Rhodotorula paludigena]